MPIYLSWSLPPPPPPPPPFLPRRPGRANKFAYSSLVPFHSAAAWKEQPGMRALRHDWLLCFFICKLESRGLFFFLLFLWDWSFLPSLLLYTCSSPNEEPWARWYSDFFHLCFEIDLNRWCMSLCVFLTAFPCWTLTPLPLPTLFSIPCLCNTHTHTHQKVPWSVSSDMFLKNVKINTSSWFLLQKLHVWQTLTQITSLFGTEISSS